MAYNYPNYYGYPAQQFQQQYGQPQTNFNPISSQLPQAGTQMSVPNQDERIWVQGEGAAQAYLVAPNAFVRLWDSQSPVFYEKRADQSGRPYMETYEYKRKDMQAPSPAVSQQTPAIDYEAKIKALEARIEALEGGKKNDAEQ